MNKAREKPDEQQRHRPQQRQRKALHPQAELQNITPRLLQHISAAKYISAEKIFHAAEATQYAKKAPAFAGAFEKAYFAVSALAELRRAAGGLETVLNQFFRLFPVFSRVSAFCLAVSPTS